MEYVHTLTVNVENRTLCADEKCFPVVLNPTTTKKGVYSVESIYFNADMLTPTGKVLPASDFGGIIVDLKNTNIALHSWRINDYNTISSGCIRINLDDIYTLLAEYVFQQIEVK
jgi:hypothetical protein